MRATAAGLLLVAMLGLTGCERGTDASIPPDGVRTTPSQVEQYEDLLNDLDEVVRSGEADADSDTDPG